MPFMSRTQTSSSSRRKARTTRNTPKLVAVPSATERRAGDHKAGQGKGSGPKAAEREATERNTGKTLPSEAAPTTSGLDDPRMSDVDEWGRSEQLREFVRRIYDPVYEHWFRVEWEGFDRIPTEGGALMVANHAGAIPADAPSIMHGIERDLGRPVYGLADEIFKRVPVVNLAWCRLGGVQAHPDNAYRLLREQQQLVMVFPEGSKGPGKSYSERYQLRRFGRGGFVQIAMRSGVPIIPMSIVGNEETMPILFKLPMLARALGVPYFPVTANMLALGPLGIVVPFPAKMRIRVLEPVRFDVPPDQPRYSRSRVMDASEQIRQTIQDSLHDMLRQRRGVWSG
jgi:1-acyl-sn-glycerol-3-phosphate acyltransferase